MAEEVKAKVSFLGSKLASAKALFASLMAQVDKSVVEAIRDARIQVVDYALYVVRNLKADTTIELLQSSDSKEVGITNLNDRKLDVNNYVLITGIQLLEAAFEKAASSVTTDDLKKAEFGQISALVANGELDIKMNDKVMLPRISCEVFRRGANSSANGNLVGYMPWECPKMIQPLTEIVPTLWLPISSEQSTTSGGTTTTTSKAVKFVLHGIKTNKN